MIDSWSSGKNKVAQRSGEVDNDLNEGVQAVHIA